MKFWLLGVVLLLVCCTIAFPYNKSLFVCTLQSFPFYLSSLIFLAATGDVNNKAICRMCKVVGVDLNGKMYKLAETGE